jgi:hypothetical protein
MLTILWHLLFLFANPVIDPTYERPAVPVLSLPAGARIVGMGSSSTGDGDDPIAIKLNPGALGFFEDFQLAIMDQGLPPGGGRILEDAWLKSLGKRFYNGTQNLTPEPPWLGLLHDGMRYIYGTGVFPVKNFGIFGINYLYFTTGVTDVIDQYGNYIGSYTSYDYAIGISFGKRFGRMGIGMTGKYIYSLFFPEWIPWIEYGDGYTFAIDMGVQDRFKGLNFGFSLLNFGPGIKYEEESITRLPARLSWGISIEPIVVLDSIFFKGRLCINDINVTDVLNIKYNLDRSYDFDYPDEDIWHGSGWEFKFFHCIAYRFGSFEWMGKSNGIGLNLGIYSIDVTKFFYDFDSYHVQLTINPKLTKYTTDDYTKRRLFTIGSLFIAPGSAQFYKGEGMKGAFFFLPGIILGNYYFYNKDETKRFLSLSGIGALYLISAIEALRTR